MATVIKNQAREQQFGSYPYARLHAFFGKVWAQKHKYKVAMARRCFNLNFMLAETAKEKTLSASVISQNALLLYADEIAEYYLQHQQFPAFWLRMTRSSLAAPLAVCCIRWKNW